MSNHTNTKLLERAAELIDELQSHPAGLDKAIKLALDQNDLEELTYAVLRAEAELSQEYFYNNNVLDARDEY